MAECCFYVHTHTERERHTRTCLHTQDTHLQLFAHLLSQPCPDIVQGSIHLHKPKLAPSLDELVGFHNQPLPHNKKQERYKSDRAATATYVAMTAGLA